MELFSTDAVSLMRPSRRQVERLLMAQRNAAFTYPEVGATHPEADARRVADLVGHYRMTQHRYPIGHGEARFNLAVRGLREWRMFELPWLQLCWPDTPLKPGAMVAVVGQVLGAWTMNACRLVYTLDDSHPVDREGHRERRFGFAYGTLPGHALVGEERLMVTWTPENDTVWYDIHGFSRESSLLAMLGSMPMQMLQKRFADESARALIRWLDAQGG